MTLIFSIPAIWGGLCILPVLSAALPDGRPFPAKTCAEWDLGVLEALTTEEMLEREAETYRSFRNDGPEYRPSGRGELQKVLRPLLEGGGGNCPLSRGSKNWNRNSRRTWALFRYVLNVPLEKERNFVLLNCSLNRIEKKDNVWNLVSWGDIAHLEGMDSLDDA